VLELPKPASYPQVIHKKSTLHNYYSRAASRPVDILWIKCEIERMFDERMFCFWAFATLNTATLNTATLTKLG